jgi:hypothetical protein
MCFPSPEKNQEPPYFLKKKKANEALDFFLKKK